MVVADRAYLKGARVGAGLAALEAEVARILSVLGQTGAARVEPAALQPAEVLLDLYGEDIRARAFVTRDDRAEMMLRPDFTVPIVRLHMAQGVNPARYSYCGPVWRRQEFGSDRPREYLQAGLEIFGEGAPAEADAEVLALIGEALAGAPVSLLTGDMGLAIAGIEALETSAPRRAALRRHLWRPARFQELLHRFGVDQAKMTVRRAALIEAAQSGTLDAMIAEAGAPVGLRTAEEVMGRVERLVAEAVTPPLDPGKVRALEALMAVRGTCASVLATLRDFSRDLPGLGTAIDRFEARLAAFAARGIDPAALAFEAGFGRTTLEYYDGFVFGAIAEGRPDLPPIASGGRYDALTEVLGQGQGMPAVGGIIRPEALLALTGGSPQ
ncbi:MAG: ATP phosphoribosyltransferase regulatory subunit [Rhodobacteraceae bacterium]|uniref:ATP phosphoribosyltransferase regulatory subunit n=1 Tax=Amaricoccus sp. B4 TaxID=3368557 RepID=UPI000DAB7CFD|nr:ATP phosphoribosyltransferase regulatory subunit [Paracoccaceae bacterium]